MRPLALALAKAKSCWDRTSFKQCYVFQCFDHSSFETITCVSIMKLKGGATYYNFVIVLAANQATINTL